MKASTGYHSLKNLPVDSSLPHVEETSKSSQRSLTEHLHANKENPSFLTQSRAFRTTLLESVFLLLRGVNERDIYVFLLLFVFLVFRPNGFFGAEIDRD